MEIHLPICYAGVALSHCHSHVHQTSHLHGMEPRNGKEKSINERQHYIDTDGYLSWDVALLHMFLLVGVFYFLHLNNVEVIQRNG